MVEKLENLDVKGKKVMLRASFDVPLDSSKEILDPRRVRDDSRIKDVLKTLEFLIKNDAKIILAGGWLGRPKGADPELSMAPVALRLQELLREKGVLKHPVLLAPNCLDGSKARTVNKNREEVKKIVEGIKEGQIVLLENVRFDPEANANDSDFAKFVASLAGEGGIYVNEAEAQNHRPEATVVSVPKYIKQNGGQATFGLRYVDVIEHLGNTSKVLEKNDRGPFVFFLSGKKIETKVGITSKISVTHALLDKMKEGDVIVVQGAVIYTFLMAENYHKIEKVIDEAKDIIDRLNQDMKEENTKAKKQENSTELILENEKRIKKEKSEKLKELIGVNDEELKKLIGSSFAKWDEIGEQIIFAAEVILKAKSKGVKVIINKDHVIANKFPDKYGNLPEDADIKNFEKPIGIPAGWLGVAPGPKTMDLISDAVKGSYFLILAGPISIEDARLEGFCNCNKKLLESIKVAKDKGSITIAAGGDTSAMVRSFSGENAFTIISNAGGATLELIEKDGKLPGIIAVEGEYKG